MWQVPTSCEHQRKVPLTSHVQRWEPLIKERINFIFQVFLPEKYSKFSRMVKLEGSSEVSRSTPVPYEWGTEVHPNCSDCFRTSPSPIPPPHESLLNEQMNTNEGVFESWFIRSLAQQIPSIHYLPGTVLGTGDIEADKTDKNLYPHRVYILERGGEY